MVGDGVVPEGVQIFLTVHQNINQTLKPLGGNHDRPGQLFAFAIDLAAEDALAEVAHNLVIAVEAIKGALKRVRQGQATNEVANGDLTVLELGLKVDVSIALKGVKEDLSVGTFNHRVEVVPVIGDVQGVSPRALV